MLLERVCRVALRINIDHQNPAASFRHEPGQMNSEGRLADAALLIVDDDRVHRVNLDETICAHFIKFSPTDRAAPAGTISMKPASSSPMLV